MTGSGAAPGTEDELVAREGAADGLNQRVCGPPAAIKDLATAELDDVSVREHRHRRGLGRGHHRAVEQTLPHQERIQVMSPVGGVVANH